MRLRFTREPYLAYVVVGAVSLCGIFFGRYLRSGARISLTDLNPSLLALGIAGCAGGLMYRFVLRASARRISLGFVALLALSVGIWIFGRAHELGRWPGQSRRVGSIPTLGPVVTSATDPQLLRLGESIQQLLETGDVEAFANATAVSANDWDQILPKTTGPATEYPLGDDVVRTLLRYRRGVVDSAQQLLEFARRSGLVSFGVRFQVKLVTARSGRTMIYNVAPEQHASVRLLDSVILTLTGGPKSDAQRPGDYQIAVGGVRGFPGGWRLQGGVCWKEFPPGVADEATRHELALTTKVAEDYREQRTLTLADDEQLAKLGRAFEDLMRRRSVVDFVSNVMMGHEEIRAFEQKIDWGTAEETERNFHAMTQKVGESAQGMLNTLERLGVDLSDAEIRLKDAVAERAEFGQWSYGTTNGLRSQPIRFTFAVRSARKSKEGNSASGDYVVETGSAMRKDGRWILLDERARWQELPSAVMTKAERERIAFENYVVKHGSLPLGSLAPDVALVRLDTGAVVQLSAYRGKVVVLEWWASWCGPCQEPMTELQTLRAGHPEWKDRVEIIAVSIDNELKLAQDHAMKRQWNKTTNAWGGAGGIHSAAGGSFRVSAVPKLYVIDPQGRIIAADHPMALRVADLVRKVIN